MNNKRLRNRLLTGMLVFAISATSINVMPGVLGTNESVNAAEPRRMTVHDPSIVKSKDGVYYAFGSHLAAARSNDLINWEQYNNDYSAATSATHPTDKIYGELLTNLSRSFEWAGYNDCDCAGDKYAVWAPDVFWDEDFKWSTVDPSSSDTGAYLLYYSATSTYCRSCIGCMASKDIGGPYTYVDTVVYSGFTKTSARDANSSKDKKWDNSTLNLKELVDNGTLKDGVSSKWFSGNTWYNTNYAPNAIDPAVFYDKTGEHLYMAYGSFSGGLFMLELDPKTGRAIYPGVDGTDEASGNFVDRYFGTHIAGGSGKSGEGPYITYDKETDYYYLYESYGGLDTDKGYNMRLFRSKNPTGPYLDAVGNNAKDNGAKDQGPYGIKLIGNYKFSGETGYKAAGHNSALIDSDGAHYLVHHQRFEGNSIHQLRIRQQFLNEDGWPVTAVYEYLGSKISHVEEADVVGTYEVINHGTATDGNMIKPTQMILYSDGTVTYEGCIGVWAKKAAAGKEYDYLTIRVGGATYKGVFFKQRRDYDTSRTRMTFTVIGDNNLSLWGIRKGEEQPETEIEELPAGALVYGFDFENVKDTTVYKTKDSAKQSDAVLEGDAVVVKDDEKGNVLSISNGAGSLRGSCLMLPSDAFQTVTDGFTVSLWAKIDASTAPASALFEANVGEMWGYPMTRISADLLTRINANEYADSESYGVQKGAWHHIAYTIDATGMKTYLDGKEILSTPKDLSACFDASKGDKTIRAVTDIMVGAGDVFGDEAIRSGKFDDVMIYNKVLTAGQIRKLTVSQIASVKEPEKPPVAPAVTKKGSQTISVKSSFEKAFGDKEFSIGAKLTAGDGTLTYTTSDKKVADVNKTTGKVTINGTGIAKIKILASATAKFNPAATEITIRISPKKMAAPKAVSKKKKKINVSWKKDAKASGYEIQYALNKRFSKAKTVKISKAKTVKTVIKKGLKSKTKYFIRIRAFKKAGSSNLYGVWSPVKKVKCK